MLHFLQHLFDTSDFPARWLCGRWSEAHGYLHIGSDVAIFGAYLAIPFLLAYALRKRRDVPRPLPGILGWFIAFVACCGVTHLNEAVIFWEPIYRFAGLTKAVTAVVSWSTVLALIPALPSLLALRSPDELTREVRDKTEALRRERDHAASLAAIVESSPDAIIGEDTNGVVRSWNASAERIFGRRAEDMVGERIDEVMPDGSRAALRDMLARALRGERTGDLEAACSGAGGKLMTLAFTVSPLRDASGSLIGASVVARDITDRKRAEQAHRDAEEQLRDLYDNAPDMYATIDLESGAVTRCNGTLRERLGYTEEELAQLDVKALHSPACQDTLDEVFAVLKRDGRVDDVGLSLRTKAGGHVDVALGLTAILDGAGRVAHGRAAWRDVTDRKRAEALFALAVEASPSGMIVVDEGGRIILANAEVERLFGYAKEELQGQSVELLVPDGARERHPELREAYTQAPERRAMGAGRQLRARRKDGTTFPVEVGLNPIRTGGQRLVLGAVVDRSELMEKQRRLEERTRALQRSNEELEQFAYVASHDLQEPLRMVSSFSQLLARRYRGRLDAQADEYIYFLVDGAKRMQSLINDLLTYSRVSRPASEIGVVDASAVLQRVLEGLQVTIVEADAEVVYSTLPSVYADETQLSQVFQNLVGNAIKFRSGARRPRVEVGANASGVDWHFWVKDNGIGMDPQHQDRIFEMFQRLHERDSYAGSGIGLALVKRIVARHGGSVWVDSAPDVGSTFHFTLPQTARSVPPS